MAILGHPPVFIQTLIDILGEIFPHIPTLHGSRPETHIINYVGTCLIRAARLENAASRLAGDWMAIGHADIHGMLDLL